MSTSRSVGWMKIVAIVAYVVLAGGAAWRFINYLQLIGWKELGFLDVTVWTAVGALLVMFGWGAFGPVSFKNKGEQGGKV